MLDFAFKTSQGERAYNEDCLTYVEKDNEYVFVLADGLGGHGLGNIASEGACDIVSETIFDLGLEDSLMEVQNTLLREQRNNGLDGKMKTTITIMKIKDNTYEQLHLGDSRIYHFSRLRILSQTKDHSVCQKLVQAGLIKESEIRHHKDRNKLLNVLGMEWKEEKPYIIQTGELSKFEAILLCSDGFWEWIDESNMKKCLLKNMKSAEDWLSSMEEIVLNNGKGNHMDNYSAITIIHRR